MGMYSQHLLEDPLLVPTGKAAPLSTKQESSQPGCTYPEHGPCPSGPQESENCSTPGMQSPTKPRRDMFSTSTDNIHLSKDYQILSAYRTGHIIHASIHTCPVPFSPTPTPLYQPPPPSPATQKPQHPLGGSVSRTFGLSPKHSDKRENKFN